MPCWENPQNLAKALAEGFSQLSCFLSPGWRLAPAGIESQAETLPISWPAPPQPPSRGLGVCMRVAVSFLWPQLSSPWFHKREQNTGLCSNLPSLVHPGLGLLPYSQVGRGRLNMAECSASLKGWDLGSPWPGRGAIPTVGLGEPSCPSRLSQCTL